jgi:hypothetical protein
MNNFKIIILSLILALLFVFITTSACDGDIDTKDATAEDILKELDSDMADLIVELAESQRDKLTGVDQFEGITWADSEYTYCDRFVSAVIKVAAGGTVSKGYKSGYDDAYEDYVKHKDIADKNLIEYGKPEKNDKGAIVFFNKHEENGGFGHVGIYDGEGNIISVVDKEKGVDILRLDSFEAPLLGWISFEDYKGEILSATTLSPAEEQGVQSGEVTVIEVSSQPPSKPSLTSPYNWYQSLGGVPILIWKGDENSISYYVIVNSSNTGDIKSGWISSTSWKPTLPNENYIYSWKVKAKNSQGVESEWSESRNFSVASTTLKFEGDISFSPPSPSSADMIKIFASTTGWGGVGVTLRVSVNTATDGSSNGEWKILKELGVPKFNEVDAPEWHTNGWSNGTYRIRVEAKGPNDHNWQNPAITEATYTLVNKKETTVSYEEPISEINSSNMLLNEDFSSGNFGIWNLVGDITIYNDGGNNVAKCVSTQQSTDMYYHFYPATNNLNFSCRIKPISFSTGNIQVYAALFSGGNFLEDERLAPMYYPGDLPINSWTTFSVNLSSCPSFDMIILGAIVNGDNVVYFDDFRIY